MHFAINWRICTCTYNQTHSSLSATQHLLMIPGTAHGPFCVYATDWVARVLSRSWAEQCRGYWGTGTARALPSGSYLRLVRRLEQQTEVSDTSSLRRSELWIPATSTWVGTLCIQGVPKVGVSFKIEVSQEMKAKAFSSCRMYEIRP